MKKRILANTRFVYKSKTKQEWETENPILLNGEIGFVSDVTESDFVKIGDGKTSWNDLPYKKGPKGKDAEKVIIEQTYNAESENPQSGKAVAEALADADFENYVKKTDIADGSTPGIVCVEPDDWYGRGIGLTTYTTSDGVEHPNVLAITPAGYGDIYNKKSEYIRPITSGTIDYAVKVGLAYSNLQNELNEDGTIKTYLEWTDTEKQNARDLLETVGKNDKATTNEDKSGNLGLVRTRPDDAYGEGIEVDDNGYLKTHPAGTGDIYNQTNGHRPITPDNISYAVKVGLANSKVGYSDTEKANARTLIDAVGSSDIVNMLTSGCVTANANYEISFDLEESTLYLFWYNGSTNSLNVKVTTDGTTKTAVDAVGDELPSFQAGAIIVPKDVTSEGDEYYEKRRCMLLGYTGKTLGIPQVATKQFYYDKTGTVGSNSNVNYGNMTVANDTAGLVSVWKIKL